MIAFCKLGKLGRFGNQMFQYAFLRTQAEKLGVDFYCPKWIGDEIFHLNDKKNRAEEIKDIKYFYNEPFCKDYDRRNIKILDHADISGNFESELNFDKEKVKNWFIFKEGKFKKLREKYHDIDFSDCIGLHLRFGDKHFGKEENKIVFTPNKSYYKKSLELFGKSKKILVFSDDVEYGKFSLKYLQYEFIFIEGNLDYEDFYLMSKCKDLICTSSTFSWWAAYLNLNPDKKIVFPSEGTFRPGGPRKNKDLIPEEWIKIRATRFFLDHYLIYAFPKYNLDISRFYGQVGVRLKIYSPSLYNFLKPYFPDKI